MSNVLRTSKAFLERYHLVIAVCAVLLLLLAGGAYAFRLGDELRYLPDEQDYLTLAENLVSNGFYSLDGILPSAYRAPGYPFLLALLHFFGAEVVHYRFFNYLLLSVSLIMVYRLLLRYSSPVGASIGALLFLAYPLFFYTAGIFYPQTLSLLLFLLILVIFTQREILVRHYLAGGLLLGYLILTVPTFAFLLAVIPIWLWWRASYQQPAGLLLAVTVALLLVGLWTFRNFAAFHTFVFVSSNSGENLLLGNSENTRPNGGVNVDISHYREEAADLDEVPRDAYFRDQALKYIENHPLQSIRMYLFKFLNYFNFRNELVTNAESSSLRDLLVLFTYGPLLLFVGFRLAIAWKLHLSPFELLLITLYVLSGFVMALFFTRIRFRLPFDVLLILLAAIFLDNLLRRWITVKEENNLNRPSKHIYIQPAGREPPNL